MPGFYGHKLFRCGGSEFSRQHSTCLHQADRPKLCFRKKSILPDSLLVKQKSKSSSDSSEVTITSNGNVRYTPIRRRSQPWRKSLLSSMNTVPDPNQEFMYLCSSKKKMDSDSHVSPKMSIRDEYSSYRRRTQRTSLERVGSRTSSMSKLYSSYDAIYSEPGLENKTCDSKFTSEAINQSWDFLSTGKLEKWTRTGSNSDWGYFADCQNEGCADASPNCNSRHPTTSEKKRRIFLF